MPIEIVLGIIHNEGNVRQLGRSFRTELQDNVDLLKLKPILQTSLQYSPRHPEFGIDLAPLHRGRNVIASGITADNLESSTRNELRDERQRADVIIITCYSCADLTRHEVVEFCYSDFVPDRTDLHLGGGAAERDQTTSVIAQLIVGEGRDGIVAGRHADYCAIACGVVIKMNDRRRASG